MPTKTTTETALDQLHAHETAVLDADGRIGLLRQEEAEAIAQARQARQEVENYWSSVGTGAREHDEAELKTLACRCHELEQPIVKRAGRDGEVEVHLVYQAKIAQAQAEHREAHRVAHEFAQANRSEVELELTTKAVAAFDDLHGKLHELREAAKRSQMVESEWSRLFDLLGEMPHRSLPTSARALIEDFKPDSYGLARYKPPAPSDLLARPEVIEHLRGRGHHLLADELDREREDREGRERFAEAQAERQARKEHEAEEHQAQLAEKRHRRAERETEPRPAA